MPPELDIVIPVYNAPNDLRRCVDSVLGHAHDDCRITLIDASSSDPVTWRTGWSGCGRWPIRLTLASRS